MKARVKATGDIIEISEGCSYLYAENYDKTYNLNELEFLDVKEISFKNEPDYWEKLKHQATISAMQGLLTNPKLCDIETANSIASTAYTIATTLIDKLKEDEQNKEMQTDRR